MKNRCFTSRDVGARALNFAPPQKSMNFVKKWSILVAHSHTPRYTGTGTEFSTGSGFSLDLKSENLLWTKNPESGVPDRNVQLKWSLLKPTGINNITPGTSKYSSNSNSKYSSNSAWKVAVLSSKNYMYMYLAHPGWAQFLLPAMHEL